MNDGDHLKKATLSCFHALFLLLFFPPEEMNPLELKTERLDKKVLDKYKAKTATRHMMKAAAKLWAAGLPWEKALEVVHEAFEASAQK